MKIYRNAAEVLPPELLEQLQAGGGALTGLQALDGLTRPAAPERLQRRMGMGQPCGAFAQQQRCGAGREPVQLGRQGGEQIVLDGLHRRILGGRPPGARARCVIQGEISLQRALDKRKQLLKQ